MLLLFIFSTPFPRQWHGYSLLMRFGFLIIFSATLCLFQPTCFADEREAAPSADLLAKRFHESENKFKTASAKWTATISVSHAASVVANCTSTPAGSRVDLSIVSAGATHLLATIIDRDGFWYVAEGDQYGKYRRYEAPFIVPGTAMFLLKASPVPGMNIPTNAAFEGLKDSIATYRAPVAEAARLQAKAVLDQADAMAKTHPEVVNKPELQKTFAELRKMLANGVVWSVDVDSGYLTELGTPKLATNWSRVQWFDKTDADAIDVSKQKWVDHSAGPGAVNAEDLVMIAHEGSWMPGAPAGDSDARLLNIKTGEEWRVPFEGGISMVGCFLQDRKSVVVSGFDLNTGALAPFLVNLQTGENKRLGGPSLASGLSMMPALSHDGRTLAILHKGPTQQILEEQVYLIDLATGNSRPIGKPMDTAFLSWLLDDSGLLLLRREVDLAKNKNTGTVAVMSLAGDCKALFAGDQPLQLKNGRILFEDRSVNPAVWKTCKPDGSDPALVGDGLSKYGFASQSPDGTHLLMMQFSGNRKVPPIPTILDIDGSNPHPLPVTGGLWTTPQW